MRAQKRRSRPPEGEQLTRAGGRLEQSRGRLGAGGGRGASGRSPEKCRIRREAAGMPGWQTGPEDFSRGCKKGPEPRQCEAVDRGGSNYQPLAEEKGGREQGRCLSGGKANKCASPWQPVEGKRNPQERKAARAVRSSVPGT